MLYELLNAHTRATTAESSYPIVRRTTAYRNKAHLLHRAVYIGHRAMWTQCTNDTPSRTCHSQSPHTHTRACMHVEYIIPHRSPFVQYVCVSIVVQYLDYTGERGGQACEAGLTTLMRIWTRIYSTVASCYLTVWLKAQIHSTHKILNLFIQKIYLEQKKN